MQKRQFNIPVHEPGYNWEQSGSEYFDVIE